MINKKKKYLGLFITLGLLISVIMVSCVDYPPNIKMEIMNDINRGNYSMIVDKFEKLSPAEQLEVQQRAMKQVPVITINAKEGRIPYTQALHDLNAIKSISTPQDQVQVTNSINEITMLQNQQTGR